MPRVGNVEKRIRKVEGFDVAIKYADGRDVRGDKTGLRQYPARRAAKMGMTVAQWKSIRFRPDYPGLDVEVLDGSRNVVHGRTLLGNVRHSYSD